MSLPPLLSFPEAYDDLPGWRFSYEEMSVHVYRVTATGPAGQTIVEHRVESELPDAFARLRAEAALQQSRP